MLAGMLLEMLLCMWVRFYYVFNFIAVKHSLIFDNSRFTKVLAKTLKLLRAQLPHLKEIEGISESTFMKNLQAEVAHKLNVEQPLKKYLKNNNGLIKTLNEISYDVKGVDDIIVNLRTVSKRSVIMNNHKIVSSFGYISNLASLHSYL